MKRALKILILMIVIIISYTITVNAFTMDASIDKNELKVGEEIVYTINLDETIIATNFQINYNYSDFELIGSKTTGLNVAKKGEKIACIYADISGTGTDTFKISFRATKETSKASFSIEDAKFRADGQKTSYTGNQIIGGTEVVEVKVNKVVLPEDNTNNNTNNNVANGNDGSTSSDKLPQTGDNNMIIAIIIAGGIFVISRKIKLKKMKDILPVVLITILLGGILVLPSSTRVNAAEGEMIVKLSLTEKKAEIMLAANDEDRKITKSEVQLANSFIKSIKNENGNEIADNDILKTGYIINDNLQVVLYGDANKDGIICDTDDIMVIMDTYLGKANPDNIVFSAANLYNTDEVLDIDDIMQMMDMYLGKLTGELLLNPITNSNDTLTTNHKIHIEGYDTNTQKPLTNLTVSYTSKDGQVQMEYARADNKIDIDLNNIQQSSENEITLNIGNESIILQIEYNDNQEIVNVNTISASLNYSIKGFEKDTINLDVYI